MSRAQQNRDLYNQAVALGHSPQAGQGGGGGRYTRYLQGLIAQGDVSKNDVQEEQAPPPIKFDQTPRKLTDDGENLKIKKKSKRSRKAIGKGTGQLRISDRTGVSSVGGAQAGGTGGLNLTK